MLARGVRKVQPTREMLTRRQPRRSRRLGNRRAAGHVGFLFVLIRDTVEEGVERTTAGRCGRLNGGGGVGHHEAESIVEAHDRATRQKIEGFECDDRSRQSFFFERREGGPVVDGETVTFGSERVEYRSCRVGCTRESEAALAVPGDQRKREQEAADASREGEQSKKMTSEARWSRGRAISAARAY